LTQVRRAETAQTATVRVLGVDDFAFRTGQSYGTILVDQERRQVDDLLPDREAATLANWLEDHSGIEIVTRDRASYYADGIKKGAPQAVQIADRWRLQKNLREMLENALNRH
jgi:transposase